VGKRVVINQKSDSSKFFFLVFYSIIHTPTKKKSQHEIHCYLSVFWYLPAKWKLYRKSWPFLTAKESILEADISGSVRILFNIYILIRKVFQSAFLWCIWKFNQFCSFWLEDKMSKNIWKNFEIQTFVDPQKAVPGCAGAK
jgi:hypothetical protein